MTARHTHWVIKCFALSLLLPALAQGSPRSPTDSSCAPQTQGDVVARVEALFAALTVNDDKAVESVLTPDFYAFEGGRRFDRTSLGVRTTHNACQWPTRFNAPTSNEWVSRSLCSRIGY